MSLKETAVFAVLIVCVLLVKTTVRSPSRNTRKARAHGAHAVGDVERIGPDGRAVWRGQPTPPHTAEIVSSTWPSPPPASSGRRASTLLAGAAPPPPPPMCTP